jgi:hypothetical protein
MTMPALWRPMRMSVQQPPWVQRVAMMRSVVQGPAVSRSLVQRVATMRSAVQGPV